MNFMSELKIAKHFYQRIDGAVQVDIHPTLRCNNRCWFCISANPHICAEEHPGFSRDKTLDWDCLQRVVCDLQALGTKSVQLTGGGEPTLYPHFKELLDIIAPTRIGLFTNGVDLNNSVMTITDLVDWLRISLDASNPEMYKQIKGVDNFDRALNSLDALLAARGEKKRPRIGVAYIITTESVSGISEVVDVLSKKNIDYLQVRNVIQKGMVFSEEYQRFIDREIEVARCKEAKFPIFYTKHESGINIADNNNQELQFCDVLDYLAVIGADGEVYGCCHMDYRKDASYGSIYEHSFEEIWRNKRRVQINNEMCWNCRFTKINQVLKGLKSIEDPDFI